MAEMLEDATADSALLFFESFINPLPVRYPLLLFITVGVRLHRFSAVNHNVRLLESAPAAPPADALE